MNSRLNINNPNHMKLSFIQKMNRIASLDSAAKLINSSNQSDSGNTSSASSSIHDLTELDNLLDELYTAKVILNKVETGPANLSQSNANSDQQQHKELTTTVSYDSTPSPSSSSPLSTSSSFSAHSQLLSHNSLFQPSQTLSCNSSKHNSKNSRSSVEKMYQLIEAKNFARIQKPINRMANTSKATQELQSLMASLSMYKNDGSIKSGQKIIDSQSRNTFDNSSNSKSIGDETPPELLADKSETSLNKNIDCLPDNSENLCFGCLKPIHGQVITALGHLWHPDHFTCYHCKNCIGTSIFYEKDNRPFCENDYLKLFSPKCAACESPILDKMLTALNKSWHIQCFVCNSCNKTLNDESFLEIKNEAFCKDCYSNKLAPKCKRCEKSIVENFISALNGYWHPECFACQECGSTFNSTSFFDYQNMPYCEIHYHQKRGSLCSGCQMPINGRCITAMNKKFHPEHFTCSFCLRPLNKGTFKEKNERPFCQPCFHKLFP